MSTLFATLGPIATGDDPRPVVGVLQLTVGALFWWLAVREWRSRPGPGEEPEEPGWLSAVEDLSWWRCCGLGALLAAVNPKNLGLTVAAGSTIGAAGLPAGQTAVAVLAFVLLGSSVMLAVAATGRLAGDRARPLLEALRGWLAANSATVMLILFVVLGASLVGDGLGTLL